VEALLTDSVPADLLDAGLAFMVQVLTLQQQGLQLTNKQAHAFTTIMIELGILSDLSTAMTDEDAARLRELVSRVDRESAEAARPTVLNAGIHTRTWCEEIRCPTCRAKLRLTRSSIHLWTGADMNHGRSAVCYLCPSCNIWHEFLPYHERVGELPQMPSGMHIRLLER